MTDLRFAFRQLAKSPGYTVVSLLTLSLGIGACTAIFTILDAVLLTPLHFRDPARLVWVLSSHPQEGHTGLAGAAFTDLASANQAFAGLTMRVWSEEALTQAGQTQRIDVVRAVANYFDVLGVPPLLGRTWNIDETRSGASPVVVLGQRIWERQFGGDPQIVGRTIMMNDVPHLVIGVMPDLFRDPLNPADETIVFAPSPSDGPHTRDWLGRYWGVIGRLKDGVTLAQANAELATFSQRLEREHGDVYRNWTVNALDLRSRIVRDVRSGIVLAAGAVACLLLITCSNVAGLALVRALSRRRELAVRVALGASRGQLVRQLFAENLLLAAAAGALGILAGRAGLPALLASLPAGSLPRAHEISLNPVVLAVALLVTLGTALATGLAPAFAAARADAQEALVEGSRGSRGPKSRRLQTGLVVLEIALAIALLAGAGLLGRSFLTVLARDPGMNAERVLSLSMSLTWQRYNTPAKQWTFLHRVETEVAAVPGVVSAGFTRTPPFRAYWPRSPILVLGESAVGTDNAPTCYDDAVSVDYFRSVGVRLLAGRSFSATDSAESPRVAIVTQATARRFFATLDPIGRHLAWPGGGKAEIVGVVGDTRRDGLAAEAPLQVYRPLAQEPSSYATLMVRTALPPATLSHAVQEAVWRVDSGIPLFGVGPLDGFVSETVTQPRLHLRLFAVCAGLALLLSAIGLHGVVAYSIAQRTREFGIRSALGATPLTILLQVLRESGRIIAFGLAIGLGVALLGAQFLQGMIYGVSAYDPAVFVAAAFLLAAIALIACLIPARRATKVDPMIALRAE
jgi:putative ABC transport system permease protein